jgi:hypothetical protein
MDIMWDDDEFIDAVTLAMQSDSDSDNEDIVLGAAVPYVWGTGSRKGRAPNIERRRVFYSHLLFNDFWGEAPIYNASYFKKFFKQPIGLFNEIATKVVAHDDYFRQKKDAAGKLGLTPLQKICSALRQLTSGVSSAEHDDKYRMGASTGLEAMKRYCRAIIAIYSADALRHPNVDDINRLLDEGCAAGFPGCIGSIDCMHWEWKNCPSAWKGMFQGKSGVPTVVLEAIADHRCRFWHFNFGSPGTLNDLNILDRSPLFDKAVRGEAPLVNFSVNGNEYKYGYWLGDGIYPNYECFVKTFPQPATRMQKMFASAQEAKRKDIERAFGILQARFHILTNGCRLWDRHAMKEVIMTCVILHNLTIDFEIKNNIEWEYIAHERYIPSHPFRILPRDPDQTAIMRAAMIAEMQSSERHTRLQHDLMIDRWEKWYSENGNDDDISNEGDDADESSFDDEE